MLVAAGARLESGLAFASLADLLRPLLAELDEIPAPQAAALMGALALGPPVAGDRFTIYAATLSLLGVCADHRPLVALVDDSGLLDASSAEALVFAARRLDAEAVALIMAVREPSRRRSSTPGCQSSYWEGWTRRRRGSYSSAPRVSTRSPTTSLTRSSPRPAEAARTHRAAGTDPRTQLSGVEPLALPLPAGRSSKACTARRSAGCRATSAEPSCSRAPANRRRWARSRERAQHSTSARMPSIARSPRASSCRRRIPSGFAIRCCGTRFTGWRRSRSGGRPTASSPRSWWRRRTRRAEHGIGCLGAGAGRGRRGGA